LFFAVSGFCLFNVKEKFGKWYLKRILRIYPVVIVFTAITVMLGLYSLTGFKDAVKLFIYPTNYVFLVWLMICYLGFYFVAYFDKKFDGFIEKTFFVLIAFWFFTYLFFIDKTYYHIDQVHKPFILFLYFGSMLMGGAFRKHYQKYLQNNHKLLNVFLLVVSLGLYFATKIVFSKIESLSYLQILNQITIFAVVYFAFKNFISIEEKLKALPNFVNKPIKFLAKITLQIYVVQFVIIARFKHLTFPLNFLVVTGLILVVASALYLAECCIRKAIIKLKENLGKNKNAENQN
jgi:peptidoglycan/LPS O-acetylase OafA/YrhL